MFFSSLASDLIECFCILHNVKASVNNKLLMMNRLLRSWCISRHLENEKNSISWRNTAFVFYARFSVRRCEFMVSSMTLIDFPISKADVVSKGIRHLEKNGCSAQSLTRLKSIIKHLGKLVELMSFF